MKRDSGTHRALREVAARPPQGGVAAGVLLGMGTAAQAALGTRGHLTPVPAELTSHHDQTG